MKKLYFARQAVSGTLLDEILARGIAGERPCGLCGGRMACGRCRVRFLSGAPFPGAADRKFFSPEELRAGWRLACTARSTAECEVEVCFVQGPKTEILTVSHAGTGSAAQESATEPGKDRAAGIAGISAGTVQDRFCAVDLGTTTVVMQLTDRVTGDVLLTHAFENPQRVYGTDVLSRLAAAADGKGELLQALILEGLKSGLAEMEQAGGFHEIILSGNTAMGHLLLGYPTETLGRAPFVPYHIGSTRFSLAEHPALFLPGISAFVGADIVSGIYACGMARRDELSLFLGLGNNGEMALGNREGVLCTGTAAGSAFEGIVSAQIAGTDITALAFSMLREGIMDETGLLREPWFTEGWPAGADGRIVIRQQDIRELQMAKAAVCAGVSILLDRMDGWERLARVYLAGGFGYYLDVEKAVGIGLIPAALRGRCQAVGNTSLAGAVLLGRAGRLQCQADIEERRLSVAEDRQLHHIVQISSSLNLARQPEFEERYIEAMRFGLL